MSQSTGKKVYYLESPVTGWAQMPYNTKEVLTESGEWESPITGWVKVTCIGGGGAGTSARYTGSGLFQSIAECAGGTTFFGGISAPGGGSRGAITANGGVGLSGGCAGEVVYDYVRVSVGDIIVFSIGAGGIATGAYKTADEPLGSALFGVSTRAPLVRYGSTTDWTMAGSPGVSNGTPYGGGGGSVNVSFGNAGDYFGAGAGGGAGGHHMAITNGKATSALGGGGGAGAIILEYADPKKKA